MTESEMIKHYYCNGCGKLLEIVSLKACYCPSCSAKRKSLFMKERKRREKERLKPRIEDDTYREPWAERFCCRCGKTIGEKDLPILICDRCLSGDVPPPPVKEKVEEKKVPMLSVNEIAKRARAEGISYGQWCKIHAGEPGV